MSAIDKKQWRLRLAMGSAVLAGLVVWLFLHHLESSYQEAGETVSVLVAARYIPGQSLLQASLFQKISIPKAFVEPGALTRFEVLESTSGTARFRSLIPIPEGAQLVQRDILALSQLDTLSQTIPENCVAVSFGVDSVRGLGKNLQPGDLIDILHTPKGKMGDTTPRATSVLSQAVPIIAVGKKWSAPGQVPVSLEKNIEEKIEKDDDDVTVLTVILNPLAAVQLAQARENETLSVILRAPGNKQLIQGLP